MANPTNKTSKARTGKRRTHKILTAPNVSLCPQCHEPKLAHKVCPSCGTYKGRDVIAVEEI
ncbi:MAG: 50S ribosomal protein L32 [Nitrospirae bacterium]|nr:50S ribosomal protein L32 [Nitrospirota bacterium]MBI5694843.1 50S ribosomal protein L32 [Nitrospirota bacterium]